MPRAATYSWLLGALLALLVDPASAGSFAVSPIRVELNSASRAAVLTVRNETAVETQIQVRVVRWSQVDGEEQLDDTSELLITPPIFKLAARGEQVLRVALRRKPDASMELSYRLLIQEVPQPATADKPQLTVALRLSLPVFVAPLGRASPDMQWLARWQSDNSLHIEAQNLGKAHVQVTDFDLEIGSAPVPGASGSRYLLPGGRAHWSVKVPPAVSRDALILVRGHSDRGNIEARVALVTGR